MASSQVVSDDFVEAMVTQLRLLGYVVTHPGEEDGVAVETYRQVIINALSAMVLLPEDQERAVAYLREQWLPFALAVKETWEKGNGR